MEDEYRIMRIDDTSKYPWGVIGGGIGAYNEEKAGDDTAKNLCYVLQGPDDEILGGVIGAVYWDWFYLNLLWLPEEIRGKGHGHRLMVAIEDAAKACGATRAYLDTFSFQAPDFYKQHGYQVFGELKDFPAGFDRYFLQKEL